jgi:sugar/nucleoside kinase (ribokinase family)
LTACAPEFDLRAIPNDISILRQPSPVTTMFENRYVDGHRTQLLHAQATPIDLSAFLPPWRNAAIVHLAPIMQEVPTDTDWRALFPTALIAATPQGWLREAVPPGVVTAVPQRLLELPLQGVDVVVLSEEDVAGDEALVRRLAGNVPLVVLTRAERGATLIWKDHEEDVAAFEARVVDPTGAGDVFTAALLGMLRRSGDAVGAARWACAAAAIAIEAPGVAGLPDAAQVDRRMRG